MAPAEPPPSLRVDYDPFGVAERAGPPSARGWRLRRWLVRLAGLLLALALPFFVLIRMSVAAYGGGRVGGWGAVAVGGLSSAALLILYLWMLRARFQGRLDLPRRMWVATLTVVVSFLAFTLVYLSADNVKSAEIRGHYRALHPVLRVATGTALLFDRQGVITDLARAPEDYVRWGLPVNEASLHFPQESGFVHAVDLRTRGRPAWTNGLLHAYFRLGGFRTLRHVGTADHLHVSLPVPR